MVDIGSSADIMFYDFFRNLRIPQSELLPYNKDLIGFFIPHNPNRIRKVARNLWKDTNN